MHIADCPHLIGIVEAIGNKKNIHVAEVHNEPTVSPLDHSDAPELIGQYIPFPNLPAVLVFQPRVLADGIIIYFYRNDNDAPVIVILNCALTRCVVNEVPTLIFEQVAIYPFPIVEALASEFNLSHSLQFFL